MKLRIAECGFRIEENKSVPQSEISTPKSEIFTSE
jgi:hypothetical protein